jgi:hypothetical protein
MFLVTLLLLFVILFGLDSITFTTAGANRARDALKLVLVVAFTVWLLNGVRLMVT